MSLLTDAELASMRETLKSYLPSTAQIQANTPTDDGQHGFEDAWTTETSADCLVLQRGGKGELAEGGRVISATLWDVRFPYGTTVTARHRLLIDGETYEVLEVDTGQSNPLAVTCLCRKAV